LGADKEERSAGWYVGAIVFWLLSAWLVTVGLSSLVPQIFGPAFSAAHSDTSCAEDLHDLTRELLDRTGQYFKEPPRARGQDTLEPFLIDFDRRLMHIKPACSQAERAAFTELSRLRHGLAGLVERFDREELPHLRNLDTFFNHAAGVPPRN
jgi:hypothetical protein